jgi:RHS repeat-associated protein
MKIKLFLFLFLIAWTQTLFAGNTQYTLELTKSQIASGVMDLRDPAYIAASGASYSSKVSLIYGREGFSDLASLPGTWSYKVPYSIQFIDASGNTISTFADSLKISFNPTGAPVYESTRIYNFPSTNYYRAKLTVTTPISTTTGTATVPTDIRLELTLMKNIVEPLGTILPYLGYDAAKKIAYWGFQVGAESYQLESVYIDTFDIHTTFVNPQDPFLFKEPVRITTTDQYYNFSNTFPKGIIYFRVRGVGYFSGTTIPQYGAWSYGDYSVSNETILINSQNYEPLKNYQFVSTYAEGGKYKKVMTYADGTSRARQTLINISTDTTVIISEQKYDYEGRGVVNILPVPVKTDSLKYRNGFNHFTNKASYDNNTAAGSLTMDTTTGAARYYSTLNDFSGTVNRDYIPLAQGYPYSQVKYTRDNTRRPLQQTGVGKQFHLFNDSLSDKHFAEHFYGTPNDTELKRIFGSNAGKAKHYKKNITIDPNGQISVNYIDQEGRIVASALAGVSPGNVNPIPANNPATITVNLNENNSVDYSNYLSRSVSKIQNLVVPQTYDFKYDLTGVVNHTGSNFNSMCKTCSYNLNVTIIDPTGKIIKNIVDTLRPPTVTCSDASYTMSSPDGTITSSSKTRGMQGVVFSRIGEYTVIKELSLRPESIDTLLTSLQTGNLKYPNSDTIVKRYLATKLDSNKCNITCQDHCTAKVFKDHPTWTWAANATAINAAVATCVSTQCTINDTLVNDITRSECYSIQNQIIMQLSPGGYYNSLSGWLEAHVSSVSVWHNADGSVRTTAPSYDSLRSPDNFQLQWAADMFASNIHPEKCHYNNCISDTTSSQYEKKMFLIAGWNDAIKKGYINPLNMTTGEGFPSSISSDPNYTSAKTDPFFATGGRASGERTNLVYVMANYKNETVDNLDYDNSGGIGGIVSLWTYSNYKGLYGGVLPDTLRRWQTFKSLYLGEKLFKDIGVTTTGYCDYLPTDSSYTIVPQPFLPADTNEVNSDNIANENNACLNGCNENVIVWMNMLKAECSFSWTGSDSITVAKKLKSYCINHCGFADPYALILSSDLSTDSYLTSAQSILNGYSCKLDSIAMVNPCGRIISRQVNDVSRTAKGIIALFNEAIKKHTNSTGTANTFTFNSHFDFSSYDVYSTYSDVFSSLFSQIAFLDTTHTKYTDLCTSTLSYCDANSFLLGTLKQNHHTINEVKSFDNVRVNPANTNVLLVDVTLYNGTKYTFSSDEVIDFGGIAGGDSLVIKKGMTISVCDSISSTVANNYFQISYNTRTLKDSCIAEQKRELTDLAKNEWQDSVNIYVSSFLQSHFNKCFNSPLAEDFYYTTVQPKEYQYTLYYYDQAGGLVQTVPPAGVDTLKIGSPGFDSKGKFLNTTQPSHRLTSKYRYNSLSQPTWQKTPDGGTTNFYYDDKGELKLSQNAYQKSLSSGSHQFYSYTKYDNLGRIIEVGQVDMASPNAYDSAYFYNSANAAAISALLNDPAFPQSGGAYTLAQITQTFYDSPYSGSSITQQNLRGRVSATVYLPTISTTETKTYYTYDIHGNVKTVAQDIPNFSPKQLDYTYDLISGNVNQVTYQRGQRDQFIHQYRYDADNRILSVKTSADSIIWEEDARYLYYKHGALARTELGEDKVQGIDYAYTLQGWLKNINIPHYQALHSRLLCYKDTLDPGQDGILATGNKNQFVAQDDYGMSLAYFQGDYQPVRSNASLGAAANCWVNPASAVLGPTGKKGLYNGNIAMWMNDVSQLTTYISGVSGDRAMAYQYDQLHRIRHAYNYGTYTSDAAGYSTRDTSVLAAFDFHSQFDANGNITRLKRAGSGTTLIDDLTYNYNTSLGFITNNKLRNVTDAVGTSTTDIGNQPVDNYRYDAIGNLIKDSTQYIASIQWSVYGKILKVIRDSTRMAADGKNFSDLEFKYDPSGQRTVKIVKPRNVSTGALLSSSNWTYTFYVRDASGNVMSVYSKTGSTTLLTEIPIYGSERLGELKVSVNMGTVSFASRTTATVQSDANLGKDAIIVAGSYAVNNYGGSTYIAAETFPANGTPIRSFIDFDRSFINAGSTVLTSTLTLFGDASVGSSSGTNATYLRRITSSWTESGLTYNNQPTATTTNQVSVGAITGNNNLSATVTTLMQDIVNNASSSYGFELILQSEPGSPSAQVVFVSSDNTIAAKWPKLSVTYSSNSSDRIANQKSYELKDHLGNVRVAIGNMKVGRDNNSDSKADMYTARISSVLDYGPYGELLPGRTYTPSSSNYGFNGKRYDSEFHNNTGDIYDFHFRIYDPRLGKFLSTDPLEKEFAWNSPYAFAENRVIDGKDLEGKEWDNFMSFFSKPGNLAIKLPNVKTAQKQEYTITIQDPKKTYEAFKSEFKSHPEKILSNSKAEFHSPVDGEGKPSQFKVGAYIKIDILGPLNNSYVKVSAIDEAKDGSLNVKFNTLEGHLEKGVINFNISKGKNGINFKISSISEVDELLVPNSIARKEQAKSWYEVLDNVLKSTGGTRVGNNQSSTKTSTNSSTNETKETDTTKK